MKINNTNNNSMGISVGFLELLALLFIGLKLGGIITWNWWYVTMPLWLPAMVVVLILLIGVIVVLIGKIINWLIP
jgi:hypothetical protein